MAKDKWPAIKVTKLDAARRQLRTAIRMFFSEDDPIATHTLAAASHEIYRVLVKKKGGSSLMKDRIQFTSEKLQKTWEDGLNEAPNFFKHGARDVDKTLEFSAETTIFWIFDGVMMEGAISGSFASFPEFVIFFFWFSIEYTHVLPKEVFASMPDMDVLKKLGEKPDLKKFCLKLIRMRPEMFFKYLQG